ncbi:MAG: ParB N-terminal domain-containing protein [Brevinema sp.]
MKIKDIIVKNRIRKTLGDLEPLMKSMEKYGLISPIIVDSKNRLIAGERRLESAKLLGWTEIEVIVKDLSPSESVDLELEENTTKKDFEITELSHGYQQYLESRDKNIFHKIYYFLRNLIRKIRPKK